MLGNFIFAAAVASLPSATSAEALSPQGAAELVDQIIRRLDTEVDSTVASQVQSRLLRWSRTSGD